MILRAVAATGIAIPGFARVGLLPGVGRKFGRRMDLVLVLKHP